jgi:outer membrane beta-barrel protein
MNKVLIFLISCFILRSELVLAEIVEFPEEQLARESVVPVFDQPAAVKKRYVPLSGRFELGGFLGATLSDAFFNSYPLGLNVNYHLNEMHSINLIGAYFISQQASYVGQLQASTGQLNGQSQIPFSTAPNPNYMGLVEYEFTPYYGKISLAKQRVMNLTISATLGGGYMSLNSEGSPVGAVGLNQRFFFTRNFGLQAAIRAMFYQQTDVVVSPPTKINVQNVLVTAGVVYLLPSL